MTALDDLGIETRFLGTRVSVAVLQRGTDREFSAVADAILARLRADLWDLRRAVAPPENGDDAGH